MNKTEIIKAKLETLDIFSSLIDQAGTALDNGIYSVTAYNLALLEKGVQLLKKEVEK